MKDRQEQEIKPNPVKKYALAESLNIFSSRSMKEDTGFVFLFFFSSIYSTNPSISTPVILGSFELFCVSGRSKELNYKVHILSDGHKI